MKCKITDEAHKVIVRNAVGEFVNTGTRLDNGMWKVDLEADTFKLLQERQFPGESISDTIVRVLTLFETGGRRQ